MDRARLAKFCGIEYDYTVGYAVFCCIDLYLHICTGLLRLPSALLTFILFVNYQDHSLQGPKHTERPYYFMLSSVALVCRSDTSHAGSRKVCGRGLVMGGRIWAAYHESATANGHLCGLGPLRIHNGRQALHRSGRSICPLLQGTSVTSVCSVLCGTPSKH